jgi:hypothetical protein
MTITIHPTQLLIVVALMVSGCGPGAGRAVLLSWRTSRQQLKTVAQSKMAPKGEATFLLVSIRATGNKLYVQQEDSYVMKCEDFTLYAPDGHSVTAIARLSQISDRSGCQIRPVFQRCNHLR